MNKPGIILGPLIEVSMFETIRSFVSSGIEVIVFDHERDAPGFYMSGISERKIAPDPVTRQNDFVTFLLQLGKEYPGYVLLTNDDLYHRIISEHVEELKKNLLILVSEGPINTIASDKAETVKAALKLSLGFWYVMKPQHW
jgi:predicted ATP-grasp superfamily ATP-dependent carboligase